MDGTLADTAKVTAAAFEEAGKLFNLPKLNADKIRDAIGIGGIDFYLSLYPEQPKEVLIDFAREAEYLERIKTSVLGEEILFPDVKKTLENLSKDGYYLYIASTGDKEHVHTTLSAGKIERLFTGISCGEPEKILMVKNMIAGRDAYEWIMIGDRSKDSNAAKANNIFSLGAGFGYLNKKDYKLFDAVIDKPEDIYEYVG